MYTYHESLCQTTFLNIFEKGTERLISKNGTKYLVKWLKQSEDENTREHKPVIPKHMLKL